MLDDKGGLCDNSETGPNMVANARRTAHNGRGNGQIPASARLRSRLKLTRRQFARLTGFSERALAGWDTGKPVSEPGVRRLKEIERLYKRLAQVVRLDSIADWLNAPNRVFGGLKPLEVIERGEIDRLWRMIYYLESGVAS